jgi:exonuclease SbcC
MFKKLFSRKKPPVMGTPVKAKAAPLPATVHTDSLPELAEKMVGATGKAQAPLWTQLTEAIKQGTYSLTEVSAHLSGLPAIMFLVQHGQPTEGVSQAQWHAIALTGHIASVRKVAATELTDADLLVALAKETKGKDKSVHRIATDKLDRLAAGKKAAQALLDKQQAVLEAMRRLAHGSLEPMYIAKYKGLLEQWGELDNISDTLKEEFEANRAAAQAIFTPVEAEPAQVQAEPAEAAQDDSAVQIEAAPSVDLAPEPEPVEAELPAIDRQPMVEALLKHIYQLIESGDFSADTISAGEHFCAEMQAQWQQSEPLGAVIEADAEAFQQACRSYKLGLPKLSQLIAQYGDLATIPDQLIVKDTPIDKLVHELEDWLHEMAPVFSTDTPEIVIALRQGLQRYQENLTAHRQQEMSQVRAIRGQLRRCLSAVQDGQIRRASGLYHGVEDLLKDFDLSHHAGVRKQLDETTAALAKLRDWQAFAVLPKKEALIRRMTALIEQSLDPEFRAQSIRDMQDEWKTLSRGLQDQQQDLWEEFHRLAQLAYEPCREFFTEQRHLREVNLSKRKEVVEQLEVYCQLVDWQNPDIKEIDRVLQIARNDWTKYTPVDRIANKALQQAFDKSHRTLFDRLRQEQAVYKASKVAIIEQAKVLLTQEDIRSATDQVKKLQQQWKAIGMVGRRDEQTLWLDFRKVCDQIFARKDEQVIAFKADLEVNKEQADLLLGKMASIVDSAELLAHADDFAQFKQQFLSLGTLPKAHYQRMSTQYQDLCNAFDAARTQKRVELTDQDWQALFAWVRSARFSGQSDAEARAAWQSLTIPDPAKPLIQALTGWHQPVDDLNQQTLHEKTIDLEIMTQSESPAEDATIRMQLKVHRLATSMGAVTTDADINQLVVEWLAQGAVKQDAYNALEARMLAARKRWLK